MFFYIDESGHTGINLFDKNQPVLYYGILSSKVNIDVLSTHEVVEMRRKLGVQRLHANELGDRNITRIASNLDKLRHKLKLRFNLCYIVKRDFALITFFDSIFDDEYNKNVSCNEYNTPIRYLILLELDRIFDESNLKKSWEAQIEKDSTTSNNMLSEVCREVKKNINLVKDEKTRKIIHKALCFAENNPSKISYNQKNKQELLYLSPNTIGFGSVILTINSILKKKKRKASKIIVDRQLQYNKSQKSIHEDYIDLKNLSIDIGYMLPETDFTNTPELPLSFTASCDSFGLELVDIYLWIFKRSLENKKLSNELNKVKKSIFYSGMYHQISLNAVRSNLNDVLLKLKDPC